MISINDKNQIVIYPVLPVVQNGEITNFTTTITLREIGELYNRLTYDGDAQRGYITREIGKEEDIIEIRERMIDKKHVESIKEAFLDGESIRGHLTWNIRAFEDIEDLNLDYYEYDAIKNTLTIIGNTITLPDSAHRHEAIHQIYKQDKDNDILDNQMVLDIYNLTFEEEKQFFVDVNGKIKLPHRNRTLFLSNDIKCELVRDIIENSDLKDRVETMTRYAKDNKLIKFAALYDSLFGMSSAGVYKHVNINKHNYDEYKDWLIKFYNELLKTRPEFQFSSMKQRNEFKEENMIAEELTWWAYAYLAKQLKDDPNWKRSLRNKMNKTVAVGQGVCIDFWSKANTIWHGGILLFKFNNIDQKVEATRSVYNSNATKKRIQDVVAIQLFS